MAILLILLFVACLLSVGYVVMKLTGSKIFGLVAGIVAGFIGLKPWIGLIIICIALGIAIITAKNE